MNNNQLNIESSSMTIDPFEALLAYIDGCPPYPINVNDLIDICCQFNDFLNFSEETSNEQQHTIFYQSSITNEVDIDASFSSNISDSSFVDSSDTSPINSLDDNDKIYFDSTEWYIKDSRTGRTRSPRLYEFLRLLVNNPRYKSYASWINKDEGLFKLHKPTEVTELWTKVKCRETGKKMDYAKLSRSIRYYYEDKIMISTHIKHTYRFGINS